MKEEQKKIELLQKIAHRLNEAHVQWALGASMLLYFKSITSEFHDIDLMVADHDAECVRTILSEMGELCPPDPMPNPRSMSWLVLRSCTRERSMIVLCVKIRSWRKCGLEQKSSRCNRRSYGANTIA